jgi:hypothetical protein
MRCMSHQSFILQTTSMLIHESSIFSRLYSIASFLGPARYWNRLTIGWSEYCTQVPVTRAVVRRSPPFSPDVAAFLDYMHCWHGKTYEPSADSDPTSNQYIENLKDYFRLSPTKLGGPPHHPCTGTTCCPNGILSTRQHFRDRGKVWLTRGIGNPATNKWTKQWRSVDWCFAIMTVHGPTAPLVP